MFYNRAVRRLVAIAIALLIVFPAISPLFALGSAGDPARAACCRRDGKHHCMLMDKEGSSSSASTSDRTRITTPGVSERCPYGSRALRGTSHPDWSLHASEAIFAGIVAHPSVVPQTESKQRISADRSRQKRGPPAFTLA